MSNYFYLNLALWLVILFAITFQLFLKFYFTRSYSNYSTPQINSGNNVIPNKDIDKLVDYYKNLFGLNDWTIIYELDLPFKNFGRGYNKKKKEIYIKRVIFTSVGYEIDYIISRLWYVNRTINKDNKTKTYSFISNYLMKITVVLLLAVFLLQTFVMFYGTAFDKDGVLPNDAINWLWQYPLLFVIDVLLIFGIILYHYILSRAKEEIEIEYTKDVLLKFKELFPEYFFDLRSARAFSQGQRFAYNLSFKIGISSNGDIKWLGPFLNY